MNCTLITVFHSFTHSRHKKISIVKHKKSTKSHMNEFCMLFHWTFTLQTNIAMGRGTFEALKYLKEFHSRTGLLPDIISLSNIPPHAPGHSDDFFLYFYLFFLCFSWKSFALLFLLFVCRSSSNKRISTPNNFPKPPPVFIIKRPQFQFVFMIFYVLFFFSVFISFSSLLLLFHISWSI